MKYFLKEATLDNARFLICLPVLALCAVVLGFAWTYGAEYASYQGSRTIWRPAYEGIVPNPGLPSEQLPDKKTKKEKP